MQLRLTQSGHGLDLDIMVSNRQARFMAIDKQANGTVVPLNGLGTADGLACETPDARAPRQRLPFIWLCIPLARVADFRP